MAKKEESKKMAASDNVKKQNIYHCKKTAKYKRAFLKHFHICHKSLAKNLQFFSFSGQRRLFFPKLRQKIKYTHSVLKFSNNEN